MCLNGSPRSCDMRTSVSCPSGRSFCCIRGPGKEEHQSERRWCRKHKVRTMTKNNTTCSGAVTPMFVLVGKLENVREVKTNLN